jgi:hypothetical protein
VLALGEGGCVVDNAMQIFVGHRIVLAMGPRQLRQSRLALSGAGAHRGHRSHGEGRQRHRGARSMADAPAAKMHPIAHPFRLKRDEAARQKRGQFFGKDMPILRLDAEACALSVVIWSEYDRRATDGGEMGRKTIGMTSIESSHDHFDPGVAARLPCEADDKPVRIPRHCVGSLQS